MATLVPVTPQQIQIITKPGGLSPVAHLLNVLLCLVTLFVWLPVYLAIALLAPSKRIEVIAPAGTDPTLIEAARAEAQTLTPAERKSHNTKVAVVLGTALVVIVVWSLALNSR